MRVRKLELNILKCLILFYLFFIDRKNYVQDKYSSDEVEERIYEGDVYYIEGGEKSEERSLMCGNGIVNGNEGCAVCGNPSSKVCSRCKAIKYW